MITYASLDTPVGILTPYVRRENQDDHLVAVLWDDEPHRLMLSTAQPCPGQPSGVLQLALEQLAAYFEGTLTEFSVPIRPVGTEFQLAAWRALTAIPFGETSTYARQAERIGKPTAVRAVGAANGRNPIPIIVPCHRVIGSNGSLTGFAGGLDSKRWLLDHERRLAGKATPQLW